MKRLKVLLSVVFACVFAFTFALAGCSGCGDTEESDGSDEVRLVEFAIDTSNVKTDYLIGESISYDGLVITRGVEYVATHTFEYDQVISIDDCVVETTFDSTEVGEYTVTIQYTLGDITMERSYTVTVLATVRLSGLSIDYTNAQTRFNLADEFSYEGLSITAVLYNYASGVQDSTFAVDLDDENLVVDSSAFDSTQEGQYPITVSYTYEDITVSASYTVRVLVGAGLYMEIVGEDGTEYSESITYPMTEGGTTIDLSVIDVYLADVNGKTPTRLTEGYTLKAFYGDEEIAITDNKFVAEQGGAYNVWAYYEDYTVPGTSITVDLDDFIIIYVTDTLTSIELSNPDTAVTTQPAGSDVMSSTWTFTATYSSGTTKQLTIDDVEVTGLDTRTVTENGVATITYTEADALGTETTVTTTVNYIIEAASGNVTETFEFSYDELTAAITSALGSAADKTDLISEYFDTESNSFLTVNISDSNDQYRTSGGGCFEIKNGSVSVTFSGTGTLTITVSSTGGSNTSEIGLVDSEGNYISATITGTNAVENDAGYYEVTGTTYVTLTFDITEAGTYSLVSNLGTNNRGVRIQTIVMVDNY